MTLPEQVSAVAVKTSRGRFAALEARPGRGVCERQPALLLPGYTGSKEDFLPILQSLAEAGRMAIAIDLRGQYQSPPAASPAGYAPGELASDVIAVAEAIAAGRDGRAVTGHGGLSGVHLAGHSMGGLIAREAVLTGCAGPVSLALIGSGPGRIPGERARLLRAALAGLGLDADEADPGTDRRASQDAPGTGWPADGPALAADRLRPGVRRLWEEYLAPDAVAAGTGEGELAFLRARFLGSCPAGLAVMARNLLRWPDRTAELATRAASHGLPILVLYGENDDAWPPALQDDMAARLGARRVCVPGAGHSPAVDAPETTATALTEFWNAAECSRRSPGAAATGSAG
jgi:pimeloyl-ACP methyl ester carboxylesterase